VSCSIFDSSDCHEGRQLFQLRVVRWYGQPCEFGLVSRRNAGDGWILFFETLRPQFRLPVFHSLRLGGLIISIDIYNRRGISWLTVSGGSRRMFRSTSRWPWCTIISLRGTFGRDTITACRQPTICSSKSRLRIRDRWSVRRANDTVRRAGVINWPTTARVALSHGHNT